MSVTILEALMNAEFNLCQGVPGIQHVLGKDQLHNAVTLLEKGYSLDDEVEPLLEQYGAVGDVPEKEE